MILKSLYLKNYRTYKGPEKISFAEGDANVTIIQGNNEVGKTTIMNAITWCLYGVEFYKDGGNEPIYSKSTSYDLEKGDDDLVEVILTMVDSKGKEVKFIRNLEFYKNDIGECRDGASEHGIYVDGKKVSFEDIYLSKHLPMNIREYFLFDGEQLENYFENDNKRNSNIKKSVYKLSHLDLLEKTEKHLNNRISDFQNQLSRLNPLLAKYLKDQTTYNNKIKEIDKKLSKIEVDLEDWHLKISDCRERIKRYGEDPTILIDRKVKLESQVIKLNDDLDRIENDYTKFLIRNFPKILSISSLINVQVICKDLAEKGYIPARFKKEFLEYLLEEHECVCGADLSEGTDNYVKLKELYDKTDETTNIADTVNLLLGNVNSIISNFPINFKEELVKKLSDIEKLNTRRSELDKEVTDINEKLINIDEDHVKKLQKDILTYEHLIAKNTEEKGKLKERKSKYEEWLENTIKAIKREELKQGKKTDIENSINFCTEAKNEISKIYNDLESDIHAKLQSLTSEEFKKMHWKEEFYQGVTLNKDYNVLIHKEGGDILPNDLSKGGQLVLALSFMTALNSLSGFELPIVIDTPLGRLDEPIKENIGKFLPIYTKNKQVTLLVTSSEYSEGFKKGIRNYVGKEYKLNYIQDNDGITTITNIR